MELQTSLPLNVRPEIVAFKASLATLEKEVSVEPAALVRQKLKYISL